MLLLVGVDAVVLSWYSNPLEYDHTLVGLDIEEGEIDEGDGDRAGEREGDSVDLDDDDGWLSRRGRGCWNRLKTAREHCGCGSLWMVL